MIFKKWIGFLLSFSNYFYKTKSIFQNPAKKILQTSYLVSFTENEADFLGLCAQSFNYQVDYSLGFRQKEVYAMPLQQVTFLGNSGALLIKDKLLIESVFDVMRLVKSPAFKTFAWMGWSKKKQGLFTSVMHFPWAEQSNYHWFLDCLPRICSLLETVQEPVQVIVPHSMPAFQRETLAFLLNGNPNFSLVPIGKHEKWQLTNFIFPSFATNHNSGYLPKAFLQKIREQVWQGYQVQNRPEKKQLFISRRKAAKRRLLNEEAVFEVLHQLKFDLVYAEDLNYQEQIQLFYNASFIIGTHGAGLTNILFCPTNTKVIEFHSSDMVRSHYFMLCKSLGLSYNCILGSKSKENQDFYINIEILKEKILELI